MSNTPKKVLVVDDEEAILFAFTKVLAEPDLDIHTAATLGQALDLIECNSYEAVIADLRLSGDTSNDGYKVIQAVAEKQKECRIIVMTAYGDEKTKEKVFSLGAHFYLEKPVSPQKVKQLIAASMKMG
jgi:DNA-binding NtrC family response regulator